MKIVIEGTPVQQKRMKFSSRGGFAKVYDPSEKDKKKIRLEIKKQADLELFDHPSISFIFFMPIPKATSKKQCKEMFTQTWRHEKKPDVDNLIKLYLDCLDGIVFEGDQKVSLGTCIKLYSDHPRTVILLRESTQRVSPQELDELVHAEVFGEPCSLETPYPLLSDNPQSSNIL